MKMTDSGENKSKERGNRRRRREIREGKMAGMIDILDILEEDSMMMISNMMTGIEMLITEEHTIKAIEEIIMINIMITLKIIAIINHQNIAVIILKVVEKIIIIINLNVITVKERSIKGKNQSVRKRQKLKRKKFIFNRKKL